MTAEKPALPVGMLLNVVDSGEPTRVTRAANTGQPAMNDVVPWRVSGYSAAGHEAGRMRGR